MKLRYILTVLILIMALTSCSQYNKLLKTGTLQQKYDQANIYFEQGKYNKTITLYTNILPFLMGSSREDTILFRIAKAHYNSHNYEMSHQYFDEYRNKFSRMPLAQEAELLYARSFANLSLSPEKDQQETRKAISAYNEYLNRYPKDTNRVEIEQEIEELTGKLYYKKFMNAALYYKIGQYNAAITALRAALKDNPETPHRQRIMFLITRSWYDYARGSIPSKQLDRYLKMIDSYYNYKGEYPEKEESDKTSDKFGRQLDQLYDQALNFTEKNGSKSKELRDAAQIIDNLQSQIYENKDKLFEVRSKTERAALRKDNKELRAKIKVEKELLKADTKELGKGREKAIKQDIGQEKQTITTKEKQSKNAKKNKAKKTPNIKSDKGKTNKAKQ